MVVPFPALEISFIPDILKFLHGLRIPRLQPFHESGLNLSAVAHPFNLEVQCPVDEVLSCIDDVEEVPYRPQGVVGSIEMDMDSTGRICESSGLPYGPYDFLQFFDVLAVFQNRRDQFAAVEFACTPHHALHLLFTSHGRVLHDLPVPSV